MYFRFTLFNSLTLAVIALTIGMIYVRFRYALDATWPLLYYVLLIAYSESFRGSLSPHWLFAGVVGGLLLRFEFMGGIVAKGVRGVELAVFGYVIWRCLQLLLLWPW